MRSRHRLIPIGTDCALVRRASGTTIGKVCRRERGYEYATAMAPRDLVPAPSKTRALRSIVRAANAAGLSGPGRNGRVAAYAIGGFVLGFLSSVAANMVTNGNGNNGG